MSTSWLNLFSTNVFILFYISLILEIKLLPQMYKHTLTAILLLLFNYGFAQKSITDSVIAIPLIETSFSLQKPGGDLADRFGNNLSVNFGGYFKTKKNFTFGLQVQNLSGDNVKGVEDILGDVATEFGPIDGGGQIAEIIYNERGMNTTLQVGKVFNIIGPNPNSGIWIQFGAGYFWNKVKIQNSDNRAIILTDEFIKGYDRLAEGFSLNQSIGYLHLSDKKLLNFSIAFEVMEAFTTNKRKYSYKDMAVIDESYTDILYGLRFSWILPLYKKSETKYHYY